MELHMRIHDASNNILNGYVMDGIGGEIWLLCHFFTVYQKFHCIYKSSQGQKITMLGQMALYRSQVKGDSLFLIISFSFFD